MSAQLRKMIMYWFTLFLGIAILLYQFYCFVTGSLELDYKNFAVTIIAVVFMINPHAISNTYKSIINKKLNDTNVK